MLFPGLCLIESLFIMSMITKAQTLWLHDCIWLLLTWNNEEKAKKMISLSGIQNFSGWEWCLERHRWQNPLECRVLHVFAEASRKMEGICMRLGNIILSKKNWTSHALRGSFREHQLSCFSGLWLKLKSKTGIFHLQSF